MTFSPKQLTEVFLGRTIPHRCLRGMQEKISLLGEREVARTVTGRAVILQPAYGTLYSIEVSNSGRGVWLPHGFLTGDYVGYVSQTWQSVQMSEGETEVVLPRSSLHVAVRDALDGTEVLHRVAAGRVFVPNRGRATTVLYRPVVQCFVSDFQSSGSATTQEQSWTLKLEEIGR